MKKNTLALWALAIAALMLLSFGAQRAGSIKNMWYIFQKDSASLPGDWYLQPVLASDTATGRLPALHFNTAQKTFTGFTGCNQMSGTIRLQGDQLSFDKDLKLTKMACEGFNEKEFILNLLRVDHYKISGGVLMLMIDKTPVSKWLRKSRNSGML